MTDADTTPVPSASAPDAHDAPPALIVVAETAEYAQAIEAVTDQAFGPGRRARPSYRLRDGTAPITELGCVALMDDEVVGTLRFWAVTIADGPKTLLLGPLAIHPDHQNQGIGRALMAAGLGKALEHGWEAVLLVGDEPYYQRFGFSREAAQGLTMDGLDDPDRLLGLELTHGALAGASGPVRRAQEAA